MTNMKKLLTELNELREENTNLRNEVGDLQEEIRVLRNRIIKLTGQNKGLRAQMRARENTKAREFFNKINEIEKKGGMEKFLSEGGEIPKITEI